MNNVNTEFIIINFIPDKTYLVGSHHTFLILLYKEVFKKYSKTYISVYQEYFIS